MPYGPGPRGASNTFISPVFGSSRPYTPACPVNQRAPVLSKVAVLRFAFPRPAGSGYRVTSFVLGSTRTIAFWPPSVIQGAPSGPTMTPCGAEPGPSLIALVCPVLGSSQPSSPESCAVYQTPPSAAGATSCGPWPRVTGNSCSTNSAEDGVAPGLGDVPATSGAAAVADDVAIGVYTRVPLSAQAASKTAAASAAISRCRPSAGAARS